MPFPSGVVPLTSIQFASAPDENGVRLILGYSTISAFASIEALPVPQENQMFSDASVELAPGEFFTDVYIPTISERYGDFRDFPGPLFDPLSGEAFPQNIIPTSLLGGIFAFRVADATAAPEPGTLYTLTLITIAIASRLLIRRLT